VGVVLANADHAILFRMTPRGALVTDTEAIWLVRADAQDGKDYDVQRLMGVWAPTLGEDKTITENNQKGILSSRYRPGPYQPQEQRISDFGRWYRRQIAQL
jgi:Rieske 2Fe-2S family protein